MRRRRQKNPLLKRIVLISIGVHILLLPVLAHFNAFQKIQKGLVQVQMVVLPAPEREVSKPEEKQKKTTPRPTQSARKSSASSHAHQGPIRIAKNSPHIAVASGNGAEGDETDTAVQGTGTQGVLPTPGAEKGQPSTKGDANPLPIVVKPAPLPEPKLIPVTPTPQPIKPTLPERGVPVTSLPKAPLFTEATPQGEQPTPDIPDELRAEALDKTFVAECVVSTEGKTSGIRMTQSTGNDELDRRALQAARKWRFKPATRDGMPIESRVRLHIQFQVN